MGNNNAANISQREAYKLMLRDYPDVLNIDQMWRFFPSAQRRDIRSSNPAASAAEGWTSLPDSRLIFFLSLHRNSDRIRRGLTHWATSTMNHKVI